MAAMATTLPVKTMTGADGATVDIQESWLERIKGEQAVKDSVVAFLARMRSGTAATKTRGLVSGGGSKPWRQKGTGRARSGSSRSPVWRGGGTVFGPQPRSYEKKVNMKVEKLALRRAFTDRIDEGEVILVDELSFATPKTKEMTKFLAAVGAGDNVLVIVDDYSENVELAVRNLPKVLLLPASAVNTYWMLLFKKVVITNAGLEALGQRLA
ncbi:large subunit ribosomal protein L4 [Oligosphaera ethanolica]|uniref:Large ribosomal subunit protein uL4 n=2 Tax=Oligosphaera ethanolica TaxID=760260 RepID=A0AAE3VE10_9BACT|nr:large subunit ribosomal protein L4 [Oligosphaera ethanolica]